MSSIQNKSTPSSTPSSTPNSTPIQGLIANVGAAERAAEIAKEERRKATATATSIVKTEHGDEVAAAATALTETANAALAVYGLGNSPAASFLGRAFVGEVAKLARRAYK